MKYQSLFVLVMFLSVVATPTIALEDSKYGYLNVERISINLVNENATIHVFYSINTPVKLLILILGKNDLKNKLMKIMNYENATLKSIEMDNAVFSLDREVIDYQDGAYWFSSHKFNVVVPYITITTPQTTLKFSHTNEISKGVGYFKVNQ